MNDGSLFDAPDIPDVDGEKNVIEDEFSGAQNFAFVGAGAGGCRIADAFWKQGYRRVVEINTTEQDMQSLACPNTLILPVGGAAKEPKKGLEAIEGNSGKIIDKLREGLGDDVDRVLICAGSGGGTGTGSVIPLMRCVQKYLDGIGKDSNKKVGAILTVPKRSESAKVHKNAQAILSSVFKAGELSPIFLIDNDTIYNMFPDLSIGKYWPTVNNYFAQLFHAFNVLAGRSSDKAVFDETEYKTILESGNVSIGAIKLTKYDRSAISDSMRTALDSSFLVEGVDFSSAKMAATVVVGNRDTLENKIKMDDIDHAVSLLSDFLEVPTVHLGIYEGNNPDLRLYTIVGGLDAPQKRLSEVGKRGKEA